MQTFFTERSLDECRFLSPSPAAIVPSDSKSKWGSKDIEVSLRSLNNKEKDEKDAAKEKSKSKSKKKIKRARKEGEYIMNDEDDLPPPKELFQRFRAFWQMHGDECFRYFSQEISPQEMRAVVLTMFPNMPISREDPTTIKGDDSRGNSILHPELHLNDLCGLTTQERSLSALLARYASSSWSLIWVDALRRMRRLYQAGTLKFFRAEELDEMLCSTEDGTKYPSSAADGKAVRSGRVPYIVYRHAENSVRTVLVVLFGCCNKYVQEVRNEPSLYKNCSVRGKMFSESLCSRCQSVRYCSMECEQTD